MARCPFAEYRPLDENSTQPSIMPTQVIVHTAVDAPGESSLMGYFGRRDVGAESHFFVKNDGRIEQYVDTQIMANANRKADKWAISIETEDDGDPEGNPWTPAQLDALERLIRWCSFQHKIPLQLCAAYDAEGIGYHSMWGFKDPVNKVGPVLDNPWSYKYAKTCPGKTRTKQFLDVLLPRLTGDDDMTPEQERKLDEVAEKVEAIFKGLYNTIEGVGGPVVTQVAQMHPKVFEIERRSRRNGSAETAEIDYDKLADAIFRRAVRQ